MSNLLEKWYLTTGRESDETKLKATKVLFSDGDVLDNIGWRWPNETYRTSQRNFNRSSNAGDIVSYTLGEPVESKRGAK